MARIKSGMSLSEMKAALSRTGGSKEIHKGSLTALRKMSGALLPLKKDRKYNLLLMKSADQLGLYGDKAHRFYMQLGGDAMKAATLVLATHYGVTNTDHINQILASQPVDMGPIVKGVEEHVSGYTHVYDAYYMTRPAAKASVRSRPDNSEPG